MQSSAYVSKDGVLIVQTQVSHGGIAASLFNLTSVTDRKAAYDLASGIRDDFPEVAQRILLILTNSQEVLRV